MRAAPFACALLLVSPAQLWLPDQVSTPKSEVRITFSPDGKRMLWGAIGWSDGVGGWDIYESERATSGWSKPHTVSFDSTANDFDPSFAPDGSGVYFFSNRAGGLGKDDIYFAPFDQHTGHYGAPKNLGAAINSAGDEWAPVVSSDGKRLMFASDGHGGRGKHDLFIAHRRGAGWEEIENLAELNTPDEDFDATFLHDGVCVVYTSGNFESDAVALYFAAFRDGHFEPRERLPAAVNSPKQGAWTLGPSISADEPGVLYFTSEQEHGRGRADIYRIQYQLRSGAADSPQYRAWLEFKNEFAKEVAGPTGIYAIQHMLELNPGESAYLSSGATDSLRWTKTATPTSTAQVHFKDRHALISGPGIEQRDLLEPAGEPLALPNGITVRGSLLRDKTLKLWLYNAKLPAQKGFEALDYFPYDAAGVITGAFRRNEQPVATSYLDSREQAGTMYVVGTLQARIGDKTYDLKTYSYSKNWSDIDALLLLLRDRTSGKTTYSGGRVVDIHIPKGSPPQTITFDLNTAYSFLCAHSDYFNCPLVLTNNLDAELKFGEKYPPVFSGHSAKR
jgi:uncharacterized protein DUF1684/WD40 repeat protein